jgi:ABC-2 type transport system ATP-binding protein
MIEARGLSRTSGSTRALADVSFEAAGGDVVAITGPDTRARSTLLRLLATIIRPSSGLLRLSGHDAVADVFAARRAIAYVGPALAVDEKLRVDEYVWWALGSRGPAAGASRGRIDAAIALAGLDRGLPVASLTAPARAGLSLAVAVVLEPAVLVLESPVAAFDAEARPRLLSSLNDASRRGTTIAAAVDDPAASDLPHTQVLHLEEGRLARRERPADV